jgi:hypothetical protein
MATATTATKEATCVVRHSGGSTGTVTVTSPSGKVVVVDKLALRAASYPLYHTLTRQGPGQDARVVLTYEQMRVIANLNGTTTTQAPPPAVSDRLAEKAAHQEVEKQQEQAAFMSDPDMQMARRELLNGAAKDTADATVRTTAARTDSRVGGGYTEEARVRRAQAVVAETDQQMYAVTYRIPKELDAECPNPSHIFWHFGFRIDWSGWVFTQRGLNSPAGQEVLTLWKRFPGVEAHVIPYHPDACDQIRAIAREKLREEIVRCHTSLITRIDAAASRLAEAEKELDTAAQGGTRDVSAVDYERIQKLRDSGVSSALSAARKALSACLDCARTFDETGHVSDLLAGLRVAIQAQQAAFDAHRRIRG